MDDVSLSPGRLAVLTLLKRRDGVRVPEMAPELNITEAAVRQHLAALESLGLAKARPGTATGRGRPAPVWISTEAAEDHFPDGHGEFTAELVELVRDELGDVALHQLVSARTRRQRDRYQSRMPSRSKGLRQRVDALARQRTAEGYMAEVQSPQRGVYLLIEHHCPICDAASACQGFCQGELDLFRSVLGTDVEVERVSHLLSGDRRCTYRIQRRR